MHPHAAVEVRRITPDDWALLRDLRIAGLTEIPLAFGEPLSAAQARDEAAWRERAARGAAGAPSSMFLGIDGQQAVGMMGGFIDDEGQATLFGVYLRPEHRGTGLAETLHDEVASWARELGHSQLHLYVWEGNPRAVAFYERLGWQRSGKTIPHHLDPAQAEWGMVLDL